MLNTDREHVISECLSLFFTTSVCSITVYYLNRIIQNWGTPSYYLWNTVGKVVSVRLWI